MISDVDESTRAIAAGRTVLDVSETQAKAIERHLAREHRTGRIICDGHRAVSALMTCLVLSLEQGEHVHVIDGGYAKADLAFKSRLGSRWNRRCSKALRLPLPNRSSGRRAPISGTPATGDRNDATLRL